MGILSGNIKLVESAVMDDVDEGGGPPTSGVIVDGTSNSIFNDISELDRAGGRVNLRKTFVSVQTDDTDGYFGANVIVADPPDDPNVAVTLFTTNNVFDTREDAKLRVESYLAQGPLYGGFLFGDHIAGQGSVTILQREELALPANGDTFVLRKSEGLSTQTEQYVRVTKVTSRMRNFTDSANVDFSRREVTMTISDTLRADYPGFDAVHYDYQLSYTNKTKFYGTIIADAARYYGVVPLTEDVSIGDFTVQADGIFTQIVPSTRVEVPIADARMNQQASALVSAGSAFTQTFTLTFTTTQSMFIGGSVLPGSLSIVRGGITVTDKGGVLMNGSAQVGTIDYANGVAALSTNVFGGAAGTHTVTYTPAATPTIVSQSIGIPVSQQGQRLTWVATLDPAPAKATLQVSYRVLSRWYVLTEDGSGAVKGSDSSFGAGTLNFSTGTVSLTLGALPDVGSQIIFSWVPSVVSRPIASVPPIGPSLTVAFGKTLSVGSGSGIKPNTATLTWNDGTSRSATDINGLLTGDATGTVRYGSGLIEFRPNLLPAKNTTINLTLSEAVQQTSDITSLTDGGATWGFTLTAPVKARSVDLAIFGTYPVREYPGTDKTVAEGIHVFDDGSGNLQVANVSSNATVGTINYSTGVCTINKSLSGYLSIQPVYTTVTFMEDVPGSGGGLVAQRQVTQISQTGYETRSVGLTFHNGSSGLGTVSNPQWAWWTGAVSAIQARYAGSDGSATTYAFSFDEIFVASVGGIVGFNLGTHRFQYNVPTAVYIQDPSPTTGGGTAAGARAVLGGVPGVLLSSWPTGVSATPTDLHGATTPDVIGANTPMLVESATFRTAVSPLFNGGFSISGTFGNGTTFTATPDINGVIKTATSSVNGVVGKVDYDTGVVTLRFGKLGGTDDATGVQDLSYLEITGVTNVTAVGVQSDTLRYNAVGYSYIPLDANILGLDPVRLPSDGRVPIFRQGSFAVIGHTGTVGPSTVSNGQTVNCARVRLSRVRVLGDDGAVINTGYTTDLEAGTVTFTDVTGYAQPVTVEHRIEDMMLVSDAQINGQLTFTRPVTHAYPSSGAYVSSALVAGDMHARVSTTFDQATWTNVWSDDLIGSAATASYNTVANPIGVTNKGALTERWAIIFTNTTSFNVVGEHVGVIAIGNTSTDCAPVNPATGSPYFTLHATGWGLGWATGNVLRFDTVGAFYPVWVIRTIQQGPETIDSDNFTLLVRGDVDNP